MKARSPAGALWSAPRLDPDVAAFGPAVIRSFLLADSSRRARFGGQRHGESDRTARGRSTRSVLPAGQEIFVP